MNGAVSYHITRHARDEIHRRGIPQAMLNLVMAAPEQKVPEHLGLVCYQSRVLINGKTYLLRIIVDETTRPPTMVTAYRTSKINKYWSQQ